MISNPIYAIKPIEKLEQFGSSSLDNAELLALLLGGDRHIECSRKMLQYYGRLSHIASAVTAELANIPGIGRAKAARIAASVELLKRLAQERMQDTQLDTPERIYEHFAPQLSHLPQEQVMVAAVDARLKHMATTMVSIGTVSECTAHPREIMRPVLTRAAYGFVLIHNHPSGDPSPSRADECITRRLLEVANTMQVQFLDHVIVGKASPGRSPYYSFREAGIIG